MLSGIWPYLPGCHLGNTQMDAILQQETKKKAKYISDHVQISLECEKQKEIHFTNYC